MSSTTGDNKVWKNNKICYNKVCNNKVCNEDDVGGGDYEQHNWG